MSRRFVPSQHRFMRYVLYYEGVEYTVDPPDNWKEASREIARSVQYHGMIITLADKVKFSGYGAQLLREFYKKNGLLAEVDIVEYEMDDLTDQWDVSFSGTLDFSQYRDSDEGFEVLVNSEIVQKKLASRYQTEIDIDSITNLDGKEHGLGKTVKTDIIMDDRDILGEAVLDIGTEYQSNKAVQREDVCVFFTNRSESYNGDLPRTYTVAKEFFSPTSPSADNLIFFNQQETKNVAGVVVPKTVTFDIDVEVTAELPAGAGPGYSIELRTARYTLTEDELGDISFSAASLDTLKVTSFSDGAVNKLVFKGEVSYNFDHREGLVLYFHHNLNGFPDSDWEYTVNRGACKISGPVRAVATRCPSYLPNTLFERMVKMMGAKSLQSDFLSESRLAVTNGYLIRNVFDANGKRPPFQITFEKLFNSFDSVNPIGLGVSGNSVFIEERDYFYQDFVSYDFGTDVSSVSIEADKERAYSEVVIGFDTSNFSREGALKEFNVKTTWVSPINSYKKELNMISNIMGSHNTIEKLRRIQFQEDTERTHTRQGDSTNFFIHLKDIENKPRTWKDDFEVVSGVKLLNSLYNLTLTPMNRLRKYGKWISFGFKPFLDRNFTFSSSTGATGLYLQPKNEVGLFENQNLQISQAGIPKYSAETITFEIQPINFYQLLSEKVLGVPKAYGKFRLQHNNEIIFGYLNSYKVDTNQLELQVAERIQITE